MAERFQERLIDQTQRDRFVAELDCNFSVIAPAGVGKTRAIIERVAAIATGDPDRARAWLPKLAVVTFTNKAADEMHQRARNAIIAARVDLPTLTAFNRAFFGTIHRFCARLLKAYGHLCGLPTQFETAEHDDDLWTAFVRQLDRLAPRLPPEITAAVTRLLPVEDLLVLARRVSPTPGEPPVLPPPPDVDLRGVLNQTTSRAQSAETYRRSQQTARDWLNAWKSGAPYAPLPECATTARVFVAEWERAFAPLRAWLGAAALAVAREIAAAYRAYCRERGLLTFDDLVELARALVRNPKAGARMRAEGYRVILDEAQDTDPIQFEILLELARPPNSSGIWLEDGGEPPEPGRFCMVGDPQQSIYGSRAELECYQRVRERLAASPYADELIFSVTFRCDRAIVDTVNSLIAPVFTRTDEQVKYVPLTPRPGAGVGQVALWTPVRNNLIGTRVDPVTVDFGRQLAAWLRNQGLARLGASRWADVAILCPRNRWLSSLAIGLREQGLGPQLHTERAIRAESPLYSWFTALMTILTDTDNSFEIVGVLREVYGIADDELARWIAEHPAGWSLSREPSGEEAPARTLRALAELAREIARLPLRDAASRVIEATALIDRVRAIVQSDGIFARGSLSGESVGPRSIGASWRDPQVMPSLRQSDNLEEELDNLFTLAAKAESEGLSTAEFAQRLRDGMEEQLPARPVDPDSVQLMTIYKAKGLQWPVVVLPLLFRTISENKKFPELIGGGRGGDPRIVFGAHDLGPIREAIEAHKRREYQRLLYVGLTRAQRTLILTNDNALFPRKKATLSFASLLGLIGKDGERIRCESFDELPTQLEGQVVCEIASVAKPAVADTAPDSRAIESAMRRLAEAPRRVLPYQLSEAEAQGERALAAVETERPPAAEAARAYGIWWHETIERMPWGGAEEEHWARACARCPLPERGAREAELLLRSPGTARLRASGLIRKCEVPILWRRSESEVVEGVIDLAAWDPTAGQWLIVDWKTNDVSIEDAESLLREIYTPQLRAYADALRAIGGAPVEAFVYSTATGLWIEIV